MLETQNSQNNLEKEEQSWRTRISQFQNLLKATVLKTALTLWQLGGTTVTAYSLPICTKIKTTRRKKQSQSSQAAVFSSP